MKNLFRKRRSRRYFSIKDLTVDMTRGTLLPEFLLDPYHYFLKISWPQFFGFLLSCFLTLNILSSLLIILDPSGEPLGNLTQDNFFLQAFFFSVQTTMTIGYGFLYPKSLYANVVVSGISFISFCFTAMSTGLVFARFSVPRAKIIYSRCATVALQPDGYQELRFRLTSARSNSLIEASLRMAVLKLEIQPDGSRMRRIYDLKLDRSNMPLVSLLWLVAHKIDEQSPLWGMTLEDMRRDGVVLFLTLTGIDATSSQSVHSRHIYTPDEILMNHGFVDVVHEDGRRRWVEMDDFHKTRLLT